MLPSEVYAKLVVYAERKARAPLDKSFVNGLSAGVWVGILGHAATSFAAGFWDPSSATNAGLTGLAYGMVFPVALMCINFTGAELFTGNVAAMATLLLERRGAWQYWAALLKVWVSSLCSNLLGCMLIAGMISATSGVFVDGTAQREYLEYLVAAKTQYGFWEAVALGVGCNAIVCLAVWVSLISDDVSGKVLSAVVFIGAFAWGKFEHCVANFYTLSVALFVGVDVPLASVILDSWLPAILGNVIGALLFDACVWWFAHSENLKPLIPCPIFGREEGGGKYAPAEVSKV